ncbi:MAG: DUF2608 domain-containing protein [Candidatus Amoebophilus sp.]
MKFIFKALLLLSIITSNTQVSFANHMFTNNTIVTIESFEELGPLIEDGNNNTLLVLDVDYTLLQPLNPAFQYGNFPQNIDFVKRTMSQVPKHLKNEFLTAIATSGKPQLIDEKAPKIIEKFKNETTQVLVISAILTGKWKNIPDIMKWRIDCLKNAGIHPTGFDFKETYSFKDFPPYRENYPQMVLLN